MKSKQSVIFLLLTFLVTASAGATCHTVCPPRDNTPEQHALEYYQHTGVSQDLSLHVISTPVQKAIATGKPENTDLSPATQRIVLQVMEGIALNDKNQEGTWVLEAPPIFLNPSSGKAFELGVSLFGRETFRTFVAAHELAHATADIIATSGRLRSEIPLADADLIYDDVFSEVFADILAIIAVADIRGQDAQTIARKVANFRRKSLPFVSNTDRSNRTEQADVLVDFAARHANEAAQIHGVDAAIHLALGYLVSTGMFDPMLLTEEARQRIRNEGCDGCMERTPFRQSMRH